MRFGIKITGTPDGTGCRLSWMKWSERSTLGRTTLLSQQDFKIVEKENPPPKKRKFGGRLRYFTELS